MKVNVNKHSEMSRIVTSSIWHRGYSREGRSPVRNAARID